MAIHIVTEANRCLNCIRTNTTIGAVLMIDNLFRDGYKAVFIGTGAEKPRAQNSSYRRWARRRRPLKDLLWFSFLRKIR